MIILVLVLCCTMILIGGIYAGYARDPYTKLIALGIIGGGTMPLIIARGYVDIAMALAIIIPLSTVFVLQLCRKGAV
ncbi:DUF2108 domain-containing protein [Methanospirillum sp.]|uniref:DUF2108 domain-containing protein n=1 Tax=Methanospirillum sp. TaxID=45200 RepID=UPI002983C283|nr:DUF2108 domain-containing protein [Methanospirillum sp.]